MKTMSTDTAVNTLGELKASAIKSVGRAFSQGESTTRALVRVFLAEEVHPAFLVSPYDKQGKVSSESKSRATPEEFDSMRVMFAAGKGKTPKWCAVSTYAELVGTDPAVFAKRLVTAKSAVKNCSDPKKKKELVKKVESLEATQKERNATLRVIGPKFRDLAKGLINGYKAQTKKAALAAGYTAKQASENALAMANSLKRDCGFESLADKGKPEDDKAKKDPVVQHAKNLLDALQKADELPLAAKDNNALIRYLTKLAQ